MFSTMAESRPFQSFYSHKVRRDNNYLTCLSTDYFQMVEQAADPENIYRSNIFLQIKAWFTDRRIVNRWNNYRYIIVELFENNYWQIEKDCRSKIYLQTKEVSAHQRIISWLMFALQNKELNEYQRIIHRSKSCLQVKELSADWRTICILKFNL